MTAGTFALIGIVLGGVIAATWNFLLKSFEHRLQRRVAARSVLDAIHLASSAAQSTLDTRDVTFLTARTFEDVISTWREHRTALASIPRAEWNQAEEVASTASILVVTGAVGDAGNKHGWDEEARRVCEGFIEAASDAATALEPYASDPRGPLGRWLARP